MARRLAIALCGGLLIAALAFFTVVAPLVDRVSNGVERDPPYPVSAAAARLHASLEIADLHADTLLWSRDLLGRSTRGHVDLPRLQEANVALQVFSVVTKVPRGINYERNRADSDLVTWLAAAARWPIPTWTSLCERALYQARRLHAAAQISGSDLVVVTSQDTLETFLARRRQYTGEDAAAERMKGDLPVAGVLALEGLHALDGDLGNLDRLDAAGFRILGLTHFFDNEIGGSAHGIAKGGLTPFGIRVLERMETLGLIVDLAHASPALVDDVLMRARRPVLVSHTGLQSVCPGPRNLSDEQALQIARRGGLIGIGFWDGAVCDIDAASIAKSLRRASELVGIDHVALGSDFDGATHTQFDVTGLPRITEALLEQGFDRAQIAAIMGGNALRFLSRMLPRR